MLTHRPFLKFNPAAAVRLGKISALEAEMISLRRSIRAAKEGRDHFMVLGLGDSKSPQFLHVAKRHAEVLSRLLRRERNVKRDLDALSASK